MSHAPFRSKVRGVELPPGDPVLWHNHDDDWRATIDGAKGHTHDGYFHIHMPDDSIVYSVIVRPCRRDPAGPPS